MDIPTNWQSDGQTKADVGHNEHGRTLAVHSLAVLPAYQGRGLGSILMKAYVQRMVESDIADKIALLTYEKLIPYYENLGFENRGRSSCRFGGGNWNDMVCPWSSVLSSAN